MIERGLRIMSLGIMVAALTGVACVLTTQPARADDEDDDRTERADPVESMPEVISRLASVPKNRKAVLRVREAWRTWGDRALVNYYKRHLIPGVPDADRLLTNLLVILKMNGGPIGLFHTESENRLVEHLVSYAKLSATPSCYLTAEVLSCFLVQELRISELLDSSNPEVVHCGVIALRNRTLFGERIRAALVLLESSKPRAGADLVRFMKNQGQSGIDTLLEEITRYGPSRKEAAALVLGRLGTPALEPTFVRFKDAISHDQTETASLFALALSGIGMPAVRRILKEHDLAYEQPRIPYLRAVIPVATRSLDKFIDLLKEHESDYKTQFFGVLCLANIKDDRAFSYLWNLAQYGTSRGIQQAARAAMDAR